MNGSTIVRVLLALVLIAGVAGFGVYVYNVGVAQGVADSARLASPESGGAPYPYYVGPFGYRPFGFGFGIFGCLIPLFFLFLFFGLLRGLFWRGGRGWGRPRHWDGGAPPMFEEWHRKAHEPQTPEKQS